MFDVYHCTAPGYLANLCSRCDDHRLRSSAHGDFITRRTTHALLIAHLLLQDLLHGMHFRLLFETLTHMQLSVVDLKLICSPYRTISLCVS